MAPVPPNYVPAEKNEPVETALPGRGPKWMFEPTRHAGERVRYDGGTVELEHYEHGRLVRYLRDTVRNEDFGSLQSMPARIHTAAAHYESGEDARADAITDLCVVGRESLAQLGARSLQESPRIDWARELAAAAASSVLPEVTMHRALLGLPRLGVPTAPSFHRVVARAKLVLEHLGAGPSARKVLAPKVGFVAVSGEDDLPHRPVNVGVTAFSQGTLDLAVWGLPVNVRYSVAGTLGANSKNVLLLHGHSSRLEEVEGLAGLLAGQGYTVIALDLPGCGYSSPMSHPHVLFGEQPVRGDSLLPFAREEQTLSRHSSLYVLRFLISSIRIFVERLFAAEGLPPRIELLAGGSLGGNLALLVAELAPFGAPNRHAWVDPRLSFVGKVASWSPASLWNVTSIAHGTPHGRSQEPEIADRRRDQFNRWMNVDHLPFVTLRQAEQWHRPGWPGKGRAIAGSWVGRHENYSSRFRTWHWIIAHEQVKFSHQDEALTPDGSGSGRRVYELAGPLLLMAGQHDNYSNANIYDRVAEYGPRMAARTLLWKDTGHSLHDERPIELSSVLVRYLNGTL